MTCRHKKRSTVLMMLLLILTLSIPTEAAVSKRTVNAVNKVVKTYFNAQKRSKISVMNKCLAKSRITRFKNTYLEKYIKKQNKKLSYRILSTSLNKKTRATVRVRCTYQSAYNLFNAAILAAADYYCDASPTEAEIYTYISDWVKQHADEYAPVSKKKTLTIVLIKRNDTWKINKLTTDMTNLLYLDLYRLVNNI